jgi:ribosomal RNA-processing protein 12
MSTVLAAVLPRVPLPVLRSRFNGASALLAHLLARHRTTSAAAAKALLQCLSTVLACYDPSAAPWPSFEGPWGAVLSALVDARPKVRKRAAAGAAEVLAALRSGGGDPAAATTTTSPPLAPASEALLRLCREVLPAPEAAARAAQAATSAAGGAGGKAGGSSASSRRAEAEAAIAAAVAGALHLMAALRQLLPLASPAAARGAVQLLLRLYALRQPLLSRHATDVLTALAQEGAAEEGEREGGGGNAAPTPATSGLDAPALAQLLSLLLKSQSDATLWDRRSPDALIGVARLVVVCEGSLTDAAPAAAAARLPQAAAALVSLLGAEQEAARHGAAEALRELVRHAVTDDVCAARGPGSSAAAAKALLGSGGGGGAADDNNNHNPPTHESRRPPPIAGVVAAVASSLSARYEEAWGHALPVVSCLIERIGQAADAVEKEQGGGAAKATSAASSVRSSAAPLLRALGELCAGAFDAGEDEGGDAGGEDGAIAAMLGGASEEEEEEEDADQEAAALRRRGRAAERRALAAERRAQRRAARRYSVSCEAAMAAALRALGPEAVLAVLPLNIREGLQAAASSSSPAASSAPSNPPAPEARTWMLPLLRRHVRGARLSFWASELLPLARFLGARAAAASSSGQRLHALNCHTLERQAWAALPAFCSWPRDAASAYPPLASALAAAAKQREDLRPFVCAALERLCRQSRAVVLLAGDSEGLFAHLELSFGQEAGGREGGGEGQDGDGGGDDSDAPSDDDDDDDENDGQRQSDDDDEDDDDDDQYNRHHRSSILAIDPRSCAADAAGKPLWWAASSSSLAAPQAKALRQHGKDWLPLLLRTFLASEPARRGPIAAAVAAVASVADPSVTSALLQTALARLARCARDAAAVAAGESPAAAAEAGPGGGALVLEGGSTPAERVASHLDVCVLLSAGVPRGASGKDALGAIFAAAKPAVLAAGGGGCGSAANPAAANTNTSNNNATAAANTAALLQKRGYKALASLAEARPEWLREQMAPLVELLLRAGPVVATAARRQRLRLLRSVLLALLEKGGEEQGSSGSPPLALPSPTDLAAVVLDQTTKRELVPGAAALADPSTPDSERAPLLAAALVAELVLSTKEANRRAREAAYGLLVEVAAEMHAARPPPERRAGGGASLMMQRMMGEVEGGEGGGGGEGSDGDGDEDEDGGVGAGGGLSDFVNMVCAGLAGGSPHMISATVMALARLLHAFPAELGAAKGGAAPRLLPAVLTLLRSKAREVVKSVLGFTKVCAARLPADVLRQHLPQILEGILLWSEDSRNRFRLRVRSVVERLCRRLGVEEVSAAAPASEAKLLTHIRKQAARKQRRRDAGYAAGGGARSSAGGSQVSFFLGGFAFFFFPGRRRAHPPDHAAPARPPKNTAPFPRPTNHHSRGRRRGRGFFAGRGHSARGECGARVCAGKGRAVAGGEGAAGRKGCRFSPSFQTPRAALISPYVLASAPRGENPQAGARPSVATAPFDWAP